jgi:hypothetical protein
MADIVGIGFDDHLFVILLCDNLEGRNEGQTGIAQISLTISSACSYQPVATAPTTAMVPLRNCRTCITNANRFSQPILLPDRAVKSLPYRKTSTYHIHVLVPLPHQAHPSTPPQQMRGHDLSLPDHF